MDNQGVFIAAESLPEDIRGIEGLSKFTRDEGIDVAGITKSYFELEKHMGNAIRVPKEGASIEEVQEYRRKLGVPDKPEGYEIDAKTIAGADEDTINAFVKLAHDSGIPKAQAQAIVKWYGENAIAAVQNKITALLDQATTTLKKEWGDGYDANILDALRGRDELLGADAEEFKDFAAKNPALGNHPILIKAFKKVADLMKEHKFVGNRQTLSGDDVDKRIRDIEADPAYYQRNNPNWQYLHEERERLYKVKYPPKQ